MCQWSSRTPKRTHKAQALKVARLLTAVAEGNSKSDFCPFIVVIDEIDSLHIRNAGRRSMKLSDEAFERNGLRIRNMHFKNCGFFVNSGVMPMLTAVITLR